MDKVKRAAASQNLVKPVDPVQNCRNARRQRRGRSAASSVPVSPGGGLQRQGRLQRYGEFRVPRGSIGAIVASRQTATKGRPITTGGAWHLSGYPDNCALYFCVRIGHDIADVLRTNRALCPAPKIALQKSDK